MGGDNDYGCLVSGLRQAFLSGRTRSVAWRISQLKGIERMLDENEEVFISALKQDLNKPVQESVVAEIDFIKNDIIGILRHIETWTQDVPVARSPLTLLDKPYLHPEPYGVALIMGAWNFPLHLSLAPLTPAIAAGNCAVVKPSEIAPATATAIQELLPKYLDNHCFKVVCGGIPETTELLKQRFDYIFYTGSTQVGKIVGAAANVHLTPCTLELGGKSPAYIDEGCNLDVVLKRLLWGKFNNCGQICVAPDYVLCSKATERKIIPKMKALLESWYTQQPNQSESYCRIVTTRHAERLKAMLEASSGKIAVGGHVDVAEKFMEPTILTGVDWNDPTMKEEIFGPILPILTVGSVDEAIMRINERDKPLALYVFSERPELVAKFQAETSSGGLTVNETLFQLSVEQLPFGGVGASGMGAYHGKAGFDTFTHYKPVLIRDLGWLGEKLGEFRYPPYNQKALRFIRNLLRNRTLPGLGWLTHLISLAVGALLGFAVTLLTTTKED